MENDYMEDDDMEIENPLEDRNMEGQMLVENDDLEDDYMEIEIPLEHR